MEMRKSMLIEFARSPVFAKMFERIEMEEAKTEHIVIKRAMSAVIQSTTSLGTSTVKKHPK